MSTTKNISDAVVQPAAYKLPEACQYLGGLSQVTVRRLVNRGLLRPNRALRTLIFPRAELDRFLADDQMHDLSAQKSRPTTLM